MQVFDGFVGREGPRDRLLAAFRDTLTGKARLVLVSGEAGIGKTSLLLVRVVGDRADDGLGAVSLGCCEPVVAQRTGLGGEGHERLVSKLGETQPSAACETVAGGEGYQAGFGSDDLPAEHAAVGDGQPCEGDVDGAVAEPAGGVLPRHLGELDPPARSALCEPLGDGRQEAASDAGLDAHAQHRRLTGGGVAGGPLGLVPALQQVSHVRQERLTGSGQGGGALVPREEVDAELLFEAADLLGQRRL